MLDNIKSIYFLKMVFSCLDNIRKLELIKYNKIFQKKLDISIIHYKLGSKKYLIIDAKRKVKEYDKDNGNLLFEGEYLNRKRNGKGKEYDKYGILLFKGEYLNGDRWNGKGYNGSNNIVYELQNGKGVVKEYYFVLNKLKIKVEYLNGKKNGKGKEYYEEGELFFEGEYINGKRWNGKFYNGINNIVYEIKNGKGFIKKYYDSICLKFEGEYLKGEKNGKGKEYYIFSEILKFDGGYLNGKRMEKGKNIIKMVN